MRTPGLLALALGAAALAAPHAEAACPALLVDAAGDATVAVSAVPASAPAAPAGSDPALDVVSGDLGSGRRSVVFTARTSGDMRAPLGRKEHSLDWSFEIGYEEDGTFVLTALFLADGRIRTELTHLSGTDPVQAPPAAAPVARLAKDGRTLTVTVPVSDIAARSSRSIGRGTVFRAAQVTTSRAVESPAAVVFLNEVDTVTTDRVWKLGSTGCPR